MSNWNNNNRACSTTWIALKFMEQNDNLFDESEAVKMSELTFWNSASTDDLRNVQANTLAVQMDNIFIMITGAEYEKSRKKQKAVKDIVDTLLIADKTIADLAAVNDDNYKFWKE
jgi:hypothetical protein